MNRQASFCRSCWVDMPLMPHTQETVVNSLIVRNSSQSAYTCPKCKAVHLSHKEMQYYERSAAATVLEQRHSGELVRYSRRAMGMQKTEFATTLDMTQRRLDELEAGASVLSDAEHALMFRLLVGPHTE